MFKRATLATVLATLILGSLTWVVAQQRNAKLTADDYIEIQQLYARYNNAIDSGDAEGYAATFILPTGRLIPSLDMMHWSDSSTTGTTRWAAPTGAIGTPI